MRAMPILPSVGGHSGAPCDRGSRALVYITVLMLAILLMVLGTTESFGKSILWLFMILGSYILCTAFMV